MKIKKLIISSFGKFQNKEIVFNDGLNLIYGENEAGKSTIHKFIEGMFYGFFKLGISKKIYNEEIQKYNPWNSDIYKGVMIYEHSGETYRLERTFTEKKDSVKLYDNITGEDLTKNLDINPVTKLPELSSHIGISKTLYTNTISISQLSTKTDSTLASEITNTIVNFNETNDTEIPIKQIQQEMEKEIYNLGTKGRKTSPIGKLFISIDQLGSELVIANEAHKYTLEFQKRIYNLTLKMQKHNNDIQQNSNLLKQHSAITATEKLKRIDSLLIENKDYTGQLSNLKFNNYMTEIDYNELQRLDSITKIKRTELNDEFSSLNKKCNEVENINRELNRFSHFKKNYDEFKNLEFTYQTYISKTSRINDLNVKVNNYSTKSNISSTSISGDYSNYKRKESELFQIRSADYTTQIQNNGYIITNIQNSINSLKTLNIFLFILCFLIVPLIFAILNISKIKAKENELSLKNIDYNKLKVSQKQQIEVSNSIEKYLKEILNKNNVIDVFELEELRNDSSKGFAYEEQLKSIKIELDEQSLKTNTLKNTLSILFEKKDITEPTFIYYKNQFETYNNHLSSNNISSSECNTLKERVSNIKNTIHRNKQNIEIILNKSNMNSVSEYYDQYKQNIKYMKIINEISTNESLLKTILNNTTIEKLKYLASLNTFETINTKIDIDLIKSKIENTTNITSLIENEISKLEENISITERNNRNTSEIDSDLNFNTTQLNNLQLKSNALTTALETINSLSKGVQKTFSPLLNKKTENIIQKITAGKYSNVKIDSNLNIRINDDSLNELVNIDNLSTGTADQLFLATRLAIIDTVSSDESLPLILDDCFVNYDDNRISKAIQYLNDEQQVSGRQLLMFTCQNREKQIIEQNNIKSNYITLS